MFQTEEEKKVDKGKNSFFPSPKRTERASNGLYPAADDFPTCYESSSSANIGTRLRPRRRDIRGSTASRARYFSAP